DLGRVVIDFDHNRVLSHWARQASCDVDRLSGRFEADEAFRRHERGEITDAEFFASLRSKFVVDLTDAQFAQGWNATFIGEMPGIRPLLAAAAKRFPLYAFSNTNNAHSNHILEHFADILEIFDEIFLSSRIGHRKPDREAYEHVVQAIGVRPAEVLFFDDVIENVYGAQRAGLRAIHVRSNNDITAALAELGID
ncbi:MAG: putative Haloacid dehalogenase-like hydrolase, partial [Mucilaginibacter sp.]|nr:putative Haloacid dehalogenase-like hydrolase [Mucilaginibacter sp.]